MTRATWTGPKGQYAIAVNVESETPSGRVWIRIVKPSKEIPGRKLVQRSALKPGWPARERRWDGERIYVPDGSISLATLEDPEFHVRVKRMVGPAVWGMVPLVLEAAAAIRRADLNKD